MNITYSEEHYENIRKLNVSLINLMTETNVPDNQSFISPIVSYFGDIHSRMRNAIENTYNAHADIFGAVGVTGGTIKASNFFRRKMEVEPYTKFMKYRAEIPEGLKVKYLDYLKILIPAQDRANSVISNIIEPFHEYCSTILADGYISKQAGFRLANLSKLEKDYGAILKGFEKCFQKNSYNASANFSDVVDRNKDWHDVFTQTQILSSYYVKYPSKNITNRLNSLYEILEQLDKRITVDKHVAYSKDVTQSLALGMYHVSREVELSALTTFRSRVMITCINRTIENFDNIES